MRLSGWNLLVGNASTSWKLSCLCGEIGDSKEKIAYSKPPPSEHRSRTCKPSRMLQLERCKTGKLSFYHRSRNLGSYMCQTVRPTNHNLETVLRRWYDKKSSIQTLPFARKLWVTEIDISKSCQEIEIQHKEVLWRQHAHCQHIYIPSMHAYRHTFDCVDTRWYDCDLIRFVSARCCGWIC